MMPVQPAFNLPQWQSIGPAPMIGSLMGKQPLNVSGRVRAIAINHLNPDIVYIGAAQGGVWKTTNGGASWTPLTDDQASLAMGAITLDRKNPDIVYVGNSESTMGGDNILRRGHSEIH